LKDNKNWQTAFIRSGANIVYIFKMGIMETSQLKLQKPWERVKETLKEINIDLTDEDLAYEPGQEDQLLERLGKKLGKSKTEVKGIIESASANKGKAS
jgi:hypothetical protein